MSELHQIRLDMNGWVGHLTVLRRTSGAFDTVDSDQVDIVFTHRWHFLADDCLELLASQYVRLKARLAITKVAVNCLLDTWKSIVNECQ